MSQRLTVLLFLALLFVGVSGIYVFTVWRDTTQRFRTGLPVPAFVLPDELKNPEDLLPSGPPRVPPIRPEDPLLAGSPSGTVEIVVFGDFQCPSCKTQAQALHTAVAALSRDEQKQLRVVWRDLPIANQHPRALAAATVAQCAARQGKFAQMHDLLFFNATDLSDTEFLRFATQLKLKTDPFLTCMRDPAIIFRLQRDLETARSYAITGVPLVFLNGAPLDDRIAADARSLGILLQRQLVTP